MPVILKNIYCEWTSSFRLTFDKSLCFSSLVPSALLGLHSRMPHSSNVSLIAVILREINLGSTLSSRLSWLGGFAKSVKLMKFWLSVWFWYLSLNTLELWWTGLERLNSIRSRLTRCARFGLNTLSHSMLESASSTSPPAK